MLNYTNLPDYWGKTRYDYRAWCRSQRVHNRTLTQNDPDSWFSPHFRYRYGFSPDKDFSLPAQIGFLRVTHIRGLYPGQMYIMDDAQFATRHLVQVTQAWADKVYFRYIDPLHLDRAPLHVNSFEFCLWDFEIARGWDHYHTNGFKQLFTLLHKEWE